MPHCRILRVTATAIAFLLASDHAICETTRDPNPWESAYAIMGPDAKSPEICARISPLAVEGVGFGQPGRQAWYVQSRCYYDIAVHTGNARLCTHVSSRITIFLDGSYFSMPNCLIQAMQSKHEPPVERLIDSPTLEQVLAKMGYAEDAIPPSFVRQNPFNKRMMWFEYYRSIVTTPEFRARIDRLPDFSGGEVPEPAIACEPHFIPTKRPAYVGGSNKNVCCPDFNGNGICDDTEPAALRANISDLTLSPVEGKPPPLLCGDQPLQIGTLLHNSGRQSFSSISGTVRIFNLNPLLVGVSEDTLRIPLPDLPPGGDAIVSFPPLRPVSTAKPLSPSYYAPRVVLCDATGSCPALYDLNIDVQPADSPQCEAERILRENPAKFGAERRKRFAPGKNLHVNMPLEIPTPPVREGVPFEVKATIRNGGPAPIDAGAGVLLLLTDYPTGFTIRAADLARPLPTLGPGETKTVTFAGLEVQPPPGASHPQWIEITVVLCTREGCNSAHSPGNRRVEANPSGRRGAVGPEESLKVVLEGRYREMKTAMAARDAASVRALLAPGLCQRRRQRQEGRRRRDAARFGRAGEGSEQSQRYSRAFGGT